MALKVQRGAARLSIPPLCPLLVDYDNSSPVLFFDFPMLPECQRPQASSAGGYPRPALGGSRHSGAVQDRDGARLLLRRLSGACKKLRLIWVDGGYRGSLLNWVADRFRFRLQVVLRSDDHKGLLSCPVGGSLNARSPGCRLAVVSARTTKPPPLAARP
jgi:hypothetical protein